MSIVNDLNELRRGSGGNTVSFPLQISGYELNDGAPEKSRLLGKRLDTGEDIAVVLRPFNGAVNHPRPEIVDLHKPRRGMRNKAVAPGGIVVVDGAYLDANENAWSARWLSTISHQPDQGAALVAPARVRVVTDKETGKPQYGSVDIAFNERAQRVTEPGQLAPAMKAALDPGVSRGLSAALLRLRDKEGNSTSFSFYGRREQTSTGDYRSLTGEEAFAKTAELPLWKKLAEKLKAVDLGNDVTAEVVPMRRVYVGPDSLKEGMDRPFLMQVGEGEGDKVRTTAGFAKSVIGLRYVGEQNEGIVAINITPVDYEPKLHLDALGEEPGAVTAKPTSEMQDPEPEADIPDVEMGDLSDLEDGASPQGGPSSTAAPAAGMGL